MMIFLRKIAGFSVGIFILLSMGCSDYDKFKQDIQNGYDKNNPDGNQGICLGFRALNRFPYTTRVLDVDPDSYDYFVNNETNNSLKGFVKLGLLKETPIGDFNGTPLFYYEVTEKGGHYLKVYSGQTFFCFGRYIILETKDIQEIKDNYSGLIKVVSVRFTLENIPDWAKSPILKETYPRMMEIKRYLNDEPLHLSIIYKKNLSGEWKARIYDRAVY